MPRHNPKIGRPRDLERPAEEAYDRLKWHEQYICFQYWNYRATRGKEGWNPTEAGSVFHQRSSAYLLSLGSYSWFRHVASKMVTLAEKFEEERKIPAAPYGEKVEAKEKEAKEKETSTPLPKKTKAYQSSSTEAPSAPIFPTMPNLFTPSTPTSNVTIAEGTPGVSSQHTGQYPPLSLPTSFGSYRKFNYTSRKKVERVCVRILVHSAVELQDIEYIWVTPNVLKLVIYWPEWFAYAEQMAMVVVDEEGNSVYPPEHPLTESFAENNAALMGENGRVMDSGHIIFDKDMKEDFQIERININIESKQLLVRGIQLFAE